ncbi:MAG: polysaccharide biosynthesis C-terminal domain-containing protein, partial [Methylocella sp.]
EWLYPARLTAALWLAGLALLPTAMTMVIEMVLVGQERLGLVAAVNIAESALRLLTMVVLIHLGATLFQIVLSFLSLRILALLLYMTDGRIRQLLRGWNFDVSRLWFYVRQSPIFCGIMLFSAAFSRFDIIFLSKLATARDVATYAVATRLFEVALMLPSILMVVLLPVFMRLFTRNRTLLEVFFRLVLRYGFVLGLPLAVIAAAASRQIVVGLFGEGFAAAILPLQLLMFCALLMAGNQLIATLLLVFDLQRFDLYGLMAGTFVLTASLLLLIPSFGIAGAACALLLGALAQFVVRILILANRTALRLRGVDVARLIAAGGIMIATIWFAPFPPPFAGLVGLATYAIALWLLHAITAADLQTTTDIFSKSKA